jgi:predicted transposase YbfD/YdcC
LEKDHGRLERRRVTTVTAPDWLEGSGNWQEVNTLIRYRCERTVGEVTTVHDHYSISSMSASAETFAALIRGHWSIENQLHWSRDVLFREDASQVRKDNTPENLNILRKTALSKLRATTVSGNRLSTKRKIFKASVNPDFLYAVLFGK